MFWFKVPSAAVFHMVGVEAYGAHRETSSG